jgi:hypothetical protein
MSGTGYNTDLLEGGAVVQRRPQCTSDNQAEPALRPPPAALHHHRNDGDLPLLGELRPQAALSKTPRVAQNI